MNQLIGVVSEYLWYGVFIILVGAGLYLTIATRAVQIRLIPEMFRVVREKSIDDDQGRKQISSFRAFTISAASRVGTGNIAGVAIAVSLGGPGAIFWMWLLGLLGGASAFMESTLAQAYKVRINGEYVGGPAYYMERGLNKRWMGVAFALIICVTYGFVFNSVQSNSIIAALGNSLEIAPDTSQREVLGIVVGIMLAIITAMIIFGGVRKLSAFTLVAVPVMALLYLALGIGVVVLNIEKVPGMFADIVLGAFGVREFVTGTVFGVFLQGLKRGLFSNEAGMGSAPNAGAAASVSHPVKQGLVQSLGVYFDTLVVCSITAFIVLLSNPVYGDKARGASLTQDALATQLGGWAVHFLTIAIFLFAFSSVIGNYYYGESNIRFLTRKQAPLVVYRVVVCGFVFLGAVLSLDLVWSLADVFMGVMATLNLVAVLMLAKVGIALMRNYTQQRRRGAEPTFHADDLGVEGMETWDGSDPVTRPLEQAAS
ncbi:alanine:cation symporter family protein [Aestuariimicrobium sp. p3-SID1156]|uniref:alanine/glycine:cation symporter family protein n=1 Tax=Aestuariimicrobium sp. p3-SID1156 TaxID=2916038 RepID=UPI00223BE352|nr:alanine/glycine:cation symporter family protein [Aestuariimicrobium sp. p3-SID1156]MCT1459814.1 alanine:cation symporter family protein [Aestuariimicrobium sp. p3-SID1156]